MRKQQNNIINNLIFTTMAKVETMIRECASNKLSGKYNLPQYKKEGTKHNAEYKKALLHKQVCEAMVAFADKHPNEGFCFIIACGSQKDAHKTSAFAKGYKKFDAEKVEMVIKMGQAYNEYNGLKGRKMSDVTWRLITRYYDQVSHDFEQFLTDLNNSKVLGKECGARGKYEELCKNLDIPIAKKELSEEDRKKIFGDAA